MSNYERYLRQLEIIGKEGQEKLLKSTVTVVGVGGLGSAVAIYLVASGVGKLILVDPEVVELSNLNRQVIHWVKDLGKAKVESAKEKLRELNPEVEVVPIKARLSEVIDEVVREADVVVDALDNWDARHLLNEYCVKYGKVLVHAAVNELFGQLMTVVPGKGPCLKCVFPNMRGGPKPIQVLGPMPGVLGTLEAIEVIKAITGYGELAVGKLVLIDAKTMTFSEVKVKRNPECPTCSKVR